MQRALPVRILVVDADHGLRRALALRLAELGCEVAQASGGAAALEALGGERFDLAACDVQLGPESGLCLLPELLARQPGLVILMMADRPTLGGALDAIREGAWDYGPKPPGAAQLRGALAESLARRDGPEELGEALLPLAVSAAVLERAGATAGREVPVLLRAEPGASTSALARAIHRRSERAGGPFVHVRARAALAADPSAELVFGKEAPGLLHAAARGTLFLDDVGALSPQAQERLLELLDREDCAGPRIVAAGSTELPAAARAGRFRADLLYRLGAVELELPPLRRRPHDIVPLARALAERRALAEGRSPPELPLATRRLLVAWPWPRDVAELRDAVDAAVRSASSRVLGPETLPSRLELRGDDAPAAGATMTAEALEREHVVRVLAWAETIAEASRVLGLDASTLRRKLRRWGSGRPPEGSGGDPALSAPSASACATTS